MLIDGSIVDKKTGAIIKNCEIVKYFNNNAVGVPMLVPDGNFINLDVILDQNISFLFSSPGYNSAFANSIDILSSGSNNFNVFLEPGSENKTPVLLGAGALALLLLSHKKNSVSGIDLKKYTPYLIIAGVLIAGGAIKKLLQGLGIMDSAATINLNQLSSDPGSYWNPGYWKQFQTFTYAITKEKATEMSIEIDQAFGYISDNVAAVNNVFHQLQTKAEVSYLADIFQQISNEDLLTYLRGGIWPNDRLSDQEVNDINLYLSKLPTN